MIRRADEQELNVWIERWLEIRSLLAECRRTVEYKVFVRRQNQIARNQPYRTSR